jgi:hypothetical protein
MAKSIVGMAKSTKQIKDTLDDLQNNGGLSAVEISLLISQTGVTPGRAVKVNKAPEGAAAGGIAGGIVGGSVGLLAGIGVLAIPGLSLFIAAGPIMGALSGVAVGATAGGIVGFLIGLGIPKYEARTFEERIKGGRYLVAVKTEDSEKSELVRSIMKENDLDAIRSDSTVSR